MNPCKILTLLLFGIAISISLGSCSKEDTEAEKKEALTIKITGDINSDSLEAQVKWLQSMGTRFALSDNRRDIATRIRNRFISMGYDEARIDSFEINKTYRGITYNQKQYNVIASLGPDNGSDSVCIIGGHYDNILQTGDPFGIVPGANDNASGVAALLEIARVLKKNQFIPAREILFIAFGAEELGLYGSTSYSGEAGRNTMKIRFMLNNDMIAYEPSQDKKQWMVNIMDYGNSRALRKEAENFCLKYTVLKPFNNNTYNAYSDSYPFYLNGFKAIFFFSGTIDPNYHTVDDVSSSCNFAYCSDIVKLNCAILLNKN